MIYKTHPALWRRPVALALSLMLALSTTAYGAEEEEYTLEVLYDEAYYATLDYYGGLDQGSVVKSYHTQGNSRIVDYGRYDAVNNLTDGTEPAIGEETVTFDLGEQPPRTFYFEGSTAEPYRELPWTVSLSYKLNGVPVKAQDLAGKCGMVEIMLDLVPNAAASEYARNNFVLMAATAFNDDEILSLEAPGAQVQLMGNLRTAVFMVLPGEEQHYTLRVGSEDFSFPGMVLTMMPATLSQLEQISGLREAKEEIQDSYDQLNSSLDVILNSLDGMGSSLNRAAGGLEELEKARGILSENKESLYDRLDDVLEDMYDLDDSFDDLNGHLTSAGHAAEDLNRIFGDLYQNIAGLRTDLKTCAQVLEQLAEELKKLEQAGGESLSQSLRLHMEQLRESLDSMESRTASLQKILDAVSSGELEHITYNGMTSDEVREKLETARRLHDAYESAGQGVSFVQFVAAALEQQGYPPQQAAEAAPQLVYLYENQQLVEEKLQTMDEGNAAIDQINDQSGRLQDLSMALGMSGDYEAALGIAGEISDLCGSLGSGGLGGDLEKLLALLDSAQTGGGTQALSAAAGDAARQADAILGQIQALLELLGRYQGEIQDSIQDGRTASSTAQDLLNDLRRLATRAKNTLRKSDKHLDRGTQDTLNGLADALRRAAVGLNETGNIRSAKDTITDLIDEKWEEHTGKLDNLLLADPNAPRESLTDSRNGEPQTVQIVLRTQEIRAEEGEEVAAEEEQVDTGTFLGRIAAMFRDLWQGLTGIFRRN